MNQNGSTALAATTPASQSMATIGEGSPLEPVSFEQGIQLAQIVAKTGMYGVKNWEDAFVRMSKGMSLGLSAAQSLSALYVIGGKPAMYADAMQALALSSPHIEYFEMVESTDTKATFEAKRRNNQKPTRVEFTIADAERAGLLKNENYKKFPKQMLRARAKADLARLICPEKLHGIYTPDELKDAGVEDRPQPAPRRPPQAATVDADTAAALAGEFARKIEEAADESSLAKIAATIKAANLPKPAAEALKKRYADRRAALREATKQAAEAQQAPTPTASDKGEVPDGEFEPVGREPGSDG